MKHEPQFIGVFANSCHAAAEEVTLLNILTEDCCALTPTTLGLQGFKVHLDWPVWCCDVVSNQFSNLLHNKSSIPQQESDAEEVQLQMISDGLAVGMCHSICHMICHKCHVPSHPGPWWCKDRRKEYVSHSTIGHWALSLASMENQRGTMDSYEITAWQLTWMLVPLTTTTSTSSTIAARLMLVLCVAT